MIKTYIKGARAERELAKKLKKRGFSVIRAAGSGGNISTPDLVAIKDGRILAFECKAWKTKPRLKKEEYKELVKWCKNSKAFGFMAWKNSTGWLFFDSKKMKKKYIEEDGLTFNDLMFLIDV